MTRIFLATIPSGADLVVDSLVAEVDMAALHAAEAALDLEARQRQALLADEATRKPNPTEKPNPTALHLRLGGLASGWLG